MSLIRRSVAVQVIGGTLLCLVSIGSFAVYDNTNAQSEVLRQQIRSHGAELARAVAMACVEPLLGRDYPVLDTHLESLVSDAQVVGLAQVVREDGNVVASVSRTGDGAAPDPSLEMFSVPILVKSNEEEEDDDDESTADSEVQKIGELRLGLSFYEAEVEIEASTARMFQQTFGSFFLVALVLVWLLTTRVQRPIRALKAHAEKLGRGNLDDPIDLKTKDEFGLLGNTMDHMRQFLAETYRQIQEQNLELEDTSRMKSEFLANMSHEIRTPMNGVVGFTDVLLQTDLSAEQQEMVSTIAMSADNLLVIINEILDYSKIEAGQMELRSAPCSLKRIVEQVHGTLRHAPAADGIILRYTLADDMPIWVVADESRIRQVLINLTSNALKFTDEGEVDLSVRFTRLSETEVSIRFQVRDTGDGIDLDQEVNLFDSFQQADGRSVRRHGGTGLGLSICRSLVLLMEGEIGVDSEVGAGSTFWFELPLCVAPAELIPSADETDTPVLAAEPESEAAPAPKVKTVVDEETQQQPASGPKLLIVDDNRVNQRLAAAIVKRLGFESDLAENGAVAVEALRANYEDYSLILMDCQMPVMDGFDATRAIRQLESETDSRIPIVAVTASAMPSDSQRCSESGMDDFLAKPLKIIDLKASLDRWLPDSESTPSQSTPSESTSEATQKNDR